MQRRRFLQQAFAASAAASLLPSTLVAGAHLPGEKKAPAFRMKYGPNTNHFKAHAGTDILDQIRFAHDQGFRAWEDNGMRRREPAVQEAMGKLFAELGMTMGVFVAYADFRNPVFAGNRLDVDDRKRDPKAVRELLKAAMEDSIAVARRAGVKWCTVVPGAVDPSLLPEHQTANAVENLKYCAEICERAGIILVLEPLNYINHPGCLLQRAAHTHQICKMVGSPSVKILFDIYHQQITEGNLITNLQDAWDEVAYIQVGDVPGRKEPTTGEINYKHIFQWLHDRGFDGVIGMEHGLKTNSLEGEKALIAAYRSIDVAA